MKISFDLDDTLIPGREHDFPTEQRSFIQKLLGVELIRLQTKEIFQDLKKHGHIVGIYTTSYRSKFKLRVDLFTYGIFPDFIITEPENRQHITQRQIHCSKYPPAFNIELHIDDSLGVEIEGQRLSFETIIIKKDDTTWLEKIREKCNLHL